MVGMPENENHERRLVHAAENTVVVRPPKQSLATFGTTSVRYYLVTEPSFEGLVASSQLPESVVREGTVRSDRPQVVTPSFLIRQEGFGDDARKYFEELAEEYGPDAPGLRYSYKNEYMETSVVSGTPEEVTARLSERLDREQRPLEAVIRGVDDLWDVSLMKFIYELTVDSFNANFADLDSRGLLRMDRGVPDDARRRVEMLFDQARKGEIDPSEAHRELERWGLFDEYQDRFLGLFKRG
jgi:hypothetical protein